MSWCTGYDNKGQHFEKGKSATASYDNKTQHFVGELVLRCLPQRFSWMETDEADHEMCG